MQIYQVFVGRQEKANSHDHRGMVFDRMMHFDWKRLSTGGFEVVYLLGLFDVTGPILVEKERGEPIAPDAPGRVPSMFAVTDHSKPLPDLGDVEHLQRLIETIHAAGLHVWLDFIPNQTSTVHPWIEAHPDYYKQHQAGFERAFSQDVFLLDHLHPGVVEEMKSIVQAIASWGADGVRCDMAHLAPRAFWQALIAEVKKDYPAFTFAAEAYSDSVFDWTPMTNLLEAGFDFTYHEFLYRNFRQAGGGGLEAVVGHLNYVAYQPIGQRLIHYASNHDDPIPEDLVDCVEALVVLMSILRGSTLVYNGSLRGFGGRLKHHFLDLLPQEQSEFEDIPSWYSNTQTILKTFSGNTMAFEQLGERVLGALVQANSGQTLRWLFNFGREAVTVEHYALTEGLLHGTDAHELLEPGKAEVWVAGQET